MFMKKCKRFNYLNLENLNGIITKQTNDKKVK